MTNSVNASGAIVLFVNTNQGLQLVYANSPRRKINLSTNGKCEDGESMAMTARREFSEELGCPEEKGILQTIVNNPENYRALGLTNKIGKTAEDIAKNIITVNADPKKLFINMAAICVNAAPQNYRELKNEVELLTKKLKKSEDFYTKACQLKYGDKTKDMKRADYAKEADRKSACDLINLFLENCRENITSNLLKVTFNKKFNDTSSREDIETAITAIVDLCENNEVGLLSKSEVESILSLDYKKNETWKELENKYFLPSIQNILLNKRGATATEFLAKIENIASSAKYISLPGTSKTTIQTSEPKEEVVSRKSCNL